MGRWWAGSGSAPGCSRNGATPCTTAPDAKTIRCKEATRIAVPLLTLDMRWTRRAGAQASTSIPLIERTGVVPRATGSSAFSDRVRGLGDSVVGAWYRGGKPTSWSWTVNGSLSIPTGSTRAPRFRPELVEGSLVPTSRLQRGSGTWDPLVGLALEHPLNGGRLVNSFVARVPLAQNRDGLRVGASWQAGTGWAHTLFTHRAMGVWTARVDPSSAGRL
jgi:hypothetical protein